MKKILMIIGAIVLFFVIIGIIIFSVVSFSSKKLVCKSDEGNITIMYNSKTITGYTTKGMTYDFDAQKEYADEIGVDDYIEEFDNWFKSNTTGTCSK